MENQGFNAVSVGERLVLSELRLLNSRINFHLKWQRLIWLTQGGLLFAAIIIGGLWVMTGR